MKIALHLECPVFAPENRIDLDGLLGHIARERHTLAWPDYADLERRLPPDVWKNYGELIKRSVKAAANSRTLFRPSDCQQCNSRALVDYLGDPFYLFVENYSTDGLFLVAACRAICKEEFSQRFSNPHHLDIIHCGGNGEIVKLIEGKLPMRPSPPPGLPLRAFVLTDSDQTAPEGTMSDMAREISSRCAELGVPCHVWSKRAIENYIPDHAFAEASGHFHGKRLKLKSMDPHERDFAPVKDYLGVKFLKDYLAAGGGFDGIALQARDGCGELVNLFDKIQEML